MNEVLLSALAVVCAYLLGSIPFAFIVARCRNGVDIREVGSHNLGAMNVFYTVGFWWGMIVLVLDTGKGAAAIGIARLLGVPLLVEFAAGFAVVIGHGYPVFLNFKGGKGGASSIGVLVALMPWGIPVYLAIFGLGLLITHFPTLSYSIAFAGFFAVAWFVYGSWQLLVFTIALLLIPVFRYVHRFKEIYKKSGGKLGRMFFRKDLRDRL